MTGMNHFSKIAVIGLGYIGLPTAAILASRKLHVIGVDINPNTVDIINQGKIHIAEPELDIVVHAAVTEGYLRATTIPEQADAFLIAVPTPIDEHHQPDLSYIESAVQSIAPVIKKGDLIILESTSPVGTTEKIAQWLRNLRSDLSYPDINGNQADIRMAYCPERVLPGHTLRELVQNDRVIGGISALCSEKAIALYKIFVEGECIVTHARTAEMCKLTENSFRDVNIALANELSMICDKLDINVWELIQLANRHPRVNILKPGPGVGGHCIAVDPWFIVSKNPEEARLIRTAREVNDSKPNWVIEKVQSAVDEFLKENPNKTAKDVTIACFGLTFKPDVDDIRESPALEIVEKLAKTHPGYIIISEPNLENLPSCIKGNVELRNSEDTFSEADVIVLLVDHQQFLNIKDNAYPKARTIDTRGILEKTTLSDLKALTDAHCNRKK